MKNLIHILFLAFISVLFGCSQNSEEKKTTTKKNEKTPLNIIFMIGDGMGVPQISTAFYFGENTPNFEQFKSIGFIKTPSTSNTITDSAAGATAFSTGEKTYNRAIGVSKDSLPLPTILETLQKKGYQTGLVSLSSITHATPASYFAHVKDRGLHDDIAADLAEANVDFFAGGGLKYFNRRADKRDLYSELISKNYKLDSVGLSKYDINKKKRISFSRTRYAHKNRR